MKITYHSTPSNLDIHIVLPRFEANKYTRKTRCGIYTNPDEPKFYDGTVANANCVACRISWHEDEITRIGLEGLTDIELANLYTQARNDVAVYEMMDRHRIDYQAAIEGFKEILRNR